MSSDKNPTNSDEPSSDLTPTDSNELSDSTSRRPMISAMSVSEMSMSGPLPPPETLKMYDMVQPGLAERIVLMAERQSSHRMELEKIVIGGNSNRANWGLVLGFVIALLFLGSGTYLISENHDWAGSSIITVTVGTLVGAFIYGTNSQKEERIEKQEKFLGIKPKQKD